ncbi:MAG TPA: isochorismatase family protein [Solirubrobacteraceae bacterium]|jgi:nicotinamidase-related amidase|nr:isochorismatase family protein [Solirubrobacteraceae bacterium]
MTGMLERHRAALVVVDVQEAFREAVGEFEAVAHGAGVLVQGGRRLGLPIVVTQQYPRGLGDTVPEVARYLEGIPRLDKLAFSACRADGFDLGEREQALVCGIEAHVCVSQTVHDLIRGGVEVHVATDAVSSRTAANRRVGLAKMERAGAVLSSVETALFELVEQAGTDEFRAVQRLVR